MTTFGMENFWIWGGTATVMVTEPDRLAEARHAVDHMVADIDEACGTDRDDCAMARIHAAPGTPVPVGATFHAVLWTALHAGEVTGGLVDPTVGSPRGAWRSIRIDEPPGTVTVPVGTTLDLWGMAKAFAVDRAAELAAAQAGCGVLVSLAGNVAVAGAPPPDGWPVRVSNGHRRHRLGDNASGHDVVLRAPGGLNTSGLVDLTRAAADGRPVPQVLDPRSGLTVIVPWRSVSVMAESCVDARTASAAAFVAGADAADWLRSRDLPARMVHTDGWETTVGNWPAVSRAPR